MADLEEHILLPGQKCLIKMNIKIVHILAVSSFWKNIKVALNILAYAEFKHMLSYICIIVRVSHKIISGNLLVIHIDA